MVNTVFDASAIQYDLPESARRSKAMKFIGFSHLAGDR